MPAPLARYFTKKNVMNIIIAGVYHHLNDMNIHVQARFTFESGNTREYSVLDYALSFLKAVGSKYYHPKLTDCAPSHTISNSY